MKRKLFIFLMGAGIALLWYFIVWVFANTSPEAVKWVTDTFSG